MADDIKTTDYMNQDGVQQLTEKILHEVNRRVKNRIVDDIKPDDTTHSPSAAAVYKAIVNKSNYMFTPYIGDLSDIGTPRTDTIYLQKFTEEDTTWNMYVYDITVGWINVGSPDIDLSNYWSKSEEDMELLKEKLGINKMVTEDQLIQLDENTIYSMIAEIDSKLRPDMPTYTLSIEYNGPNGRAIAATVTDTYPDGATYYIPSPVLNGYTPDISIVKGVITSNKVITVTYAVTE